MKLSFIAIARSIWLFPTKQLNPVGRQLYPALFTALIEKYKFQKWPQKPDEWNPANGIKFESGTYEKGPNDLIAILTLTIYEDGIVVDTRSNTNDTDAILADALAWACTEFRLEPYEAIPIRKTYASQIYVETEHSMNLLNSKLERFVQHLATNVPGFNEMPFETTGITFGPDETQARKPLPFRFERMAGAPFSENKYYSLAPMQTDAHLRLLDDLELILRGDPYSQE